MKKTILALALVLSTVTMASAADPIIVDSRSMTCSEFHNVIRTEGAVQVRDFFGDLETHFATLPICDFGFFAQFTFVPTSNVRFCQAGYVCTPDFRGGPKSEN